MSNLYNPDDRGSPENTGHFRSHESGARTVVTVANTFLAGAQKSGTSSLYIRFDNHPDCLVSDPKEPHFFCRSDTMSDMARYERCFQATDKATDRVVLDCSTSYMMHAGVAERIATTLGRDLRFVFVLREPVDRAVSAYWHAAKHGYEQRSIEEVFNLDAHDLDTLHMCEDEALHKAVSRRVVDISVQSERYDDSLWPFRYLSNSHYSKHLKPFVTLFGRDRVAVLSAEEIWRQPSTALERIAQFLNVDPAGFGPEMAVKSNQTRLKRFGSIRKSLKRIPLIRPAARLAQRVPYYDKAHRLIFAEKKASDIPWQCSSPFELVHPEVL